MPAPQPWLFTRSDPDNNVQRFYYIAVQPALLDAASQWSVLRIYGRIGGAQQEMVPVSFDDWESAHMLAQRLIQRRVKRGYVPVNP